MFSNHSIILNYEDKQPTIAAHTLFEPLFGSHFSMLLDVLKSCTEDGGNNHSLGADFTLVGSHSG